MTLKVSSKLAAGPQLLQVALARIGGAGKYPQNCERDLMRILDLPLVPGLHITLHLLLFVGLALKI